MAASNQGALSSGYKLGRSFLAALWKIFVSFFSFNMHTHQIKYFFRMPTYLIIMLNQQILYVHILQIKVNLLNRQLYNKQLLFIT